MLITDILAEEVGVSLSVLTPVFAGCLIISFCLWYYFERTLSIHTIYTARRETWYWLTVLATFCLGTALGDIVSEPVGLTFTNIKYRAKG